MSLSSAASSASTRAGLPGKPHQPVGFSYPKREFGKSTVVRRSFQPSWFTRWPWLHYLESEDAVLCHTCACANSEGKLQWSSNAESSFITKGFTNWKDATVKFGLHDSSKCHKEAVLKMLTLPSTTVSVADMLSEQNKREKRDRRHCFLKVLTSLKFLARQGRLNNLYFIDIAINTS